MPNSKGFLEHKQKAPETGGLTDFIEYSEFSLFDLFNPYIAELNFRSFCLQSDSTF